MKLLTAFITILALLSGLSNSVPVNASDLYKLRFGGGLHPLARFSASKGKNLVKSIFNLVLKPNVPEIDTAAVEEEAAEVIKVRNEELQKMKEFMFLIKHI